MILNLTPAGHPIRGVHVNGEERWSVFEFINRVCEKPKTMKGGKLAENSYASNVFGTLTGDGSNIKDSDEIRFTLERFKDARGPKTPATTVEGLSAVLRLLDGKVSGAMHAMVESTLAKVASGDRSQILVEEGGSQARAGVNGGGGGVASGSLAVDLTGGEEAGGSGAAGPGVIVPVVEESRQRERKRQQDREDALFEVEIMERKQRVADAWQRTQAQALMNTQTVVDILARLRQQEGLDGQTVVQIENQAKRIMMGGRSAETGGGVVQVSQQATSGSGVTVGSGVGSCVGSGVGSGAASVSHAAQSVGVSMNLPVGVPMNVYVGAGGADTGSSSSQAAPSAVSAQAAEGVYNDAALGIISLSGVSKDMGIKCTCGQLKELGKRMAEKYRTTLNRDPVKRRQQVGGQILLINSYSEQDRPMMEEVIRDYFVNVGARAGKDEE